MVPEPHNGTTPALEGNLALGIWVQPIVWENPAWPLSHHHLDMSAWTPSSIVNCEPEKSCQLRTLGTSPQRQQIEPALFSGCRGNLRLAFQASMWRDLLCRFSIRGTLEPFNRNAPVPRRTPAGLEQLTSPSVGTFPWPPEATRPFIGHPGQRSQHLGPSDSHPDSGTVISHPPRHIGTALRSELN